MNTINQQHLGNLFALVLISAGALLLEQAIFLRLLLGLGLGIALTKGAIGFAGSVNRAYRRGSTQLLQMLMVLFVLSAVINAGLLLTTDPSTYKLAIKPINSGLLLGGLMFGFGMTLSSCCASGVMVELASDIPRAATTLVAFGLGVFIGFPVQSSADWVRQSWFSSSGTTKGVFLPDMLSWGPFNGYLIAVLVTATLATITVWIAKQYQQHRINSGTFHGVPAEQQRQPEALAQQGSQLPLNRIWSMTTAIAVIAALVGLMMYTTNAGWGASTPFGYWFGKALMLVGVDAETLSQFTGKPTKVFTTPFFQHGTSVQNLGIVLGSGITALWLGKFSSPLAKRYALSHYALFALGGLLMGLGTRLANGCNLGALYTPISHFSLSGWVFLVVLVIGGVMGNRFARKVKLIP